MSNFFKSLNAFHNEEIFKTGVWSAYLTVPTQFITEFINSQYSNVDQSLMQKIPNSGQELPIYVSLHIDKVSGVPSASFTNLEFKSRQAEHINAPGNTTETNTIDIDITEVSTGFFTMFFNSWYKAIRYSLNGLWSPGSIGDLNIMYGSLYVWTMDATNTDVVIYKFLDCVYPTKEIAFPNLDVNVNDKHVITVSLNANLQSEEKWVKSDCQKFAEIYREKLVSKLSEVFG